MVRRTLRVTLGAVGALLAATLLSTSAAALPSAVPAGHAVGSMSAVSARPAATGSGSQSLAACLQTGRTLSALFVLDRSGSLKGNDSAGVRYDGLRVALEQLGRLKRADGTDLVAEAAIASFDDSYTTAGSVSPWTRINDGDPTKVIDTIVKSARDKTAPAGGTDFEAALTGALKDMQDRAGKDTCRVVFWFTDGIFESSPDTVDAARARMCAPKGTLDQFRQAGITIIGLQLSRPTLTDLEKMSTGSASDGTCGTTPIPEGWAGGVYLQADDTAGLKRIFGSVLSLMQGCTPTGKLGAVVDPGINRMVIDLDTPKKVTSIRLDSPDGVTMNAPATGNFDQSGYRTQSISDDFYVSMDVQFPSGKGVGTWRISPDIALTPDQIKVSVCSGLHLEFDPAPATAKAGVESTLRVVAKDAAGAVVDLRQFGKVVPGAAATAYGGTVLPSSASLAPDGAIGVTVTPRPTDGQLDVDLTVALTTRSGLNLTPLHLTKPVKAVLAAEFPMADPYELMLSEARKLNPATGTLTLIGSPVGPTKVCLEDAKAVSVPAEAAGSTVDYPRGCVDLATNERKTITVSVTPKQSAVGNGSAEIPVVLHSATTATSKSQTATVGVRVTWRFESPMDTRNFMLVLIIGLAGALIPLLAIAAANVMAAKYEVQDLAHDVIPVVLDEWGLRRAMPMAVDPEGTRVIDTSVLMPIVGLGSKSLRSFTVGGLELQSHAPWRPDQAPRFWVTAPAQSRVRSTAGPSTGRSSEAPTIPGLGFLALLVVADSALAGSAKQIPGTLVVLVRDRQAPASELDRRLQTGLGGGLLESLRSDVPPPDTGAAGGLASDGLLVNPDSAVLPPDDTYTLRGSE